MSIDEENPLDLSERVQGGEADEEDGADPAAPEEVENPVGDDAARPLPDVPLTDADQEEQGDRAFEQELTVRAIACLRLLIARAAKPLPTKRPVFLTAMCCSPPKRRLRRRQTGRKRSDVR